MSTAPKMPSPGEALGRMKAEVEKKFRRASKMSFDRTSKLASVSEAVESSAEAIGRTLHSWKSNSALTISSSISCVVEGYDNLRGNFERNVRTLTAGGKGPIDTLSDSTRSASGQAVASFAPSSKDVLDGDSFPAGTPPETSNPQSSMSTSAIDRNPGSVSSSEEIFEETSHPDHSSSSVSASSVFSMGYVGAPFMTGQGSGQMSARGAPSRNLGDGRASVMVLTKAESASSMRMVEVRRRLGLALMFLRKIRTLWLRDSSWENKMPWRKPRPPFLARGLQWPRERFSSVEERRAYHRQARRRGRYLIGPTPGWSWFAADVVLLYFLINYRPGNLFL